MSLTILVMTKEHDMFKRTNIVFYLRQLNTKDSLQSTIVLKMANITPYFTN